MGAVGRQGKEKDVERSVIDYVGISRKSALLKPYFIHLQLQTHPKCIVGLIWIRFIRLKNISYKCFRTTPGYVSV